MFFAPPSRRGGMRFSFFLAAHDQHATPPALANATLKNPQAASAGVYMFIETRCAEGNELARLGFVPAPAPFRASSNPCSRRQRGETGVFSWRFLFE